MERHRRTSSTVDVTIFILHPSFSRPLPMGRLLLRTELSWERPFSSVVYKRSLVTVCAPGLLWLADVDPYRWSRGRALGPRAGAHVPHATADVCVSFLLQRRGEEAGPDGVAVVAVPCTHPPPTPTPTRHRTTDTLCYICAIGSRRIIQVSHSLQELLVLHRNGV